MRCDEGTKMKVNNRTYVAVFLVSLAALMAEVALTRLFSFAIWYHFAYMTISVAMLGFGAAGSFYYAFPEITRRGVTPALGLTAFLAGATLVTCLIVVSSVPFDPVRLFPGGRLSLLADTRQLLYLTIFYLAVAAPFFAAGLCITIVFGNAPESIPKLYFSDLLGAAAGSALAVLLLGPLGAPGVVLFGAALLFAAGLFFASEWRPLVLACSVASLVVLAFGTFLGNSWNVPTSSMKFLSRLEAGRAKRLFHEWNPVYRVDVLGPANGGSFRMGKAAAWGVSDRYPGPVPENLVITHDGDASTMLYRLDGDSTPFKILDWSLLALPYLFHSKPNVLVIGTGGGVDVINAVRKGAAHVTAVELNPVTVRLLRENFRDYTGNFFWRPEVDLVVDEGRSFLRRSQRRYDIIQLTGVDTLAAIYSGAYVLSESYLYTKEAIQEYFSRLTERGILSFVRGDAGFGELPPRQILRLLVTMSEALEGLGVPSPQNHLIVAKSQSKGTAFPVFSVLLRRSPFTEADVKRMEEHCALTGFELWHLPGRRLSSPAAQLLSMNACEREKYLERFPLLLSATTDDRPFFFNFLRWADVFNLGKLKSDYTFAAGQLVLLAILMQSSVLAILLIVLPLFRYGHAALGTRQTAFLVYFAALGLGFMLLEISYIQRFTLFLGSPVFALAVVLAGLLVFSGLGSFLTGQLRFFQDPHKALPVMLGTLFCIVLAYILIVPLTFSAALGTSLLTRVGISLGLLAPLGLALGTFLPIGMKALRERAQGMIPWGWAANGVASVVGAIVAIFLAMNLGFRAVGLLSLAIYSLGVWAMRSAMRQPPASGAGELLTS